MARGSLQVAIDLPNPFHATVEEPCPLSVEERYSSGVGQVSYDAHT